MVKLSKVCFITCRPLRWLKRMQSNKMGIDFVYACIIIPIQCEFYIYLSHFDIGNVWKVFKAFLYIASWLIRWNKSGKEETSQPKEESKERKPLTKRGFTSEVKAGNLIYFVKTNSVEKPFETKSSEKKFQLIFRSMKLIITNQKSPKMIPYFLFACPYLFCTPKKTYISCQGKNKSLFFK